jgi:hypothetical protein
VWVQWTAPSTATYAITSCGSKVGALIAGYSSPSSACAATNVSYTSNGICLANSNPTLDCSSGATSQTFSATSGETYRFFISNYYTNQWGQVSMTINPTSAPGAANVAFAVDPPVGTTSGGTTVTITGSGFSGTPAVTFGGSAATGVTVVTSQLITAITPPHAAGSVDIQVNGEGVLASGFTYVASATKGKPTKWGGQ